jgi:uncharacterized protein YodC (DUF2158 family)
MEASGQVQATTALTLGSYYCAWLDGYHSHFARFGEMKKKILLPLPEFEPQIIQPVGIRTVGT